MLPILSLLEYETWRRQSKKKFFSLIISHQSYIWWQNKVANTPDIQQSSPCSPWLSCKSSSHLPWSYSLAFALHQKQWRMMAHNQSKYFSMVWYDSRIFLVNILWRYLRSTSFHKPWFLSSHCLRYILVLSALDPWSWSDLIGFDSI